MTVHDVITPDSAAVGTKRSRQAVSDVVLLPCSTRSRILPGRDVDTHVEAVPPGGEDFPEGEEV